MHCSKKKVVPFFLLWSSSCMLNSEVEYVAHFTSSKRNIVNLGISQSQQHLTTSKSVKIHSSEEKKKLRMDPVFKGQGIVLSQNWPQLQIRFWLKSACHHFQVSILDHDTLPFLSLFLCLQKQDSINYIWWAHFWC